MHVSCHLLACRCEHNPKQLNTHKLFCADALYLRGSIEKLPEMGKTIRVSKGGPVRNYLRASNQAKSTPTRTFLVFVANT